MHLLMGPQLTRCAKLHPQSAHGKTVAPSSEYAECSPHPFARSSRPRPLSPQSPNNAKSTFKTIVLGKSTLVKEMSSFLVPVLVHVFLVLAEVSAFPSKGLCRLLVDQFLEAREVLGGMVGAAFLH